MSHLPQILNKVINKMNNQIFEKFQPYSRQNRCSEPCGQNSRELFLMGIFSGKVARLIIMKMKNKMKKRLHIYGINRIRSRHGHNYSKHKKYDDDAYMSSICIRQYLSNI